MNFIKLLFSVCLIASYCFGLKTINAANEIKATVTMGESRTVQGNEFYVYKDIGSRLNHFIPSGWMGNTKAIKMNQKVSVDGKSLDDTCIKFSFTPSKEDTVTWAGVYWQFPANNWGTIDRAYDLSIYKKMKFKVRGEVGKEYINSFGIGGITGTTASGDSGNAEIGPIELTKEWKEYEINLDGVDLSHIIGGFVWSIDGDFNQGPTSFYLDEIRFVK